MLQNFSNLFADILKRLQRYVITFLIHLNLFNCSKGKKRNEGKKYTNANPFEETPMMPVRA